MDMPMAVAIAIATAGWLTRPHTTYHTPHTTHHDKVL